MKQLKTFEDVVKYGTWEFIHYAIAEIERIKVKTNEDISVHSVKIRPVTLQFTVTIARNQCTISKEPSPQYYGSEEDFLKLFDCRNTNKKKAVVKAIKSFNMWLASLDS